MLSSLTHTPACLNAGTLIHGNCCKLALMKLHHCHRGEVAWVEILMAFHRVLRGLLSQNSS